MKPVDLGLKAGPTILREQSSDVHDVPAATSNESPCMIRHALGWVQVQLGKSRLATEAAVAIRNQCRSVIRAHLAEGPDARTNGESLLLHHVISTQNDRPFVFFDVGANVGDWT